MPRTIVAIGDVHGCAHLLQETLEPWLGSGAELIFLGDLVDRAPEAGGDQAVLEQVFALQADPDAHGLAGVTVLRGNHEDMLLDVVIDPDPDEHTLDLWLWNGGDLALLPFAREHRAWFEALPLYAIRGPYLFVHAGVRPGVPLEAQHEQDLIWIREPFLSRDHGLPYIVVHGHSITKDFRIERTNHRIGIDTGAFRSGTLTALPLEVDDVQ
ncbi:serine/threonine protein phosphatase [Thiohalocapsa marina]|uniref:Serine/threonine protein phosphatase n=1 Tax=Thiohalocapsa marina TaxID=424902 RepID=A0A5M8FK83_9GAMM|nr:metallophosphoesterase family protein [Thiohalocapsa marina]KAA6184146.1 serine/threonine protein phosphatase [Thiohalocapsa marina]